jgi:hypothetical protein
MHQMFPLNPVRTLATLSTRIAPVLGAVGLALAASQPALADGITFDSAPIGSPISHHAEAGFTVDTTAASWFISGYGNGGSSLQFIRPDGEPTLTGAITVARAGSPFRFASVDLYSSITTIPYTITGFRNGGTVFSFSGELPHTFGNFATVANVHDFDLIDSLSIRVTNPDVGFGGNPVGIDNINVSAVPEPESYAMMVAGLAALAGVVSRRRRQA